jgi:hypothetical protein
LAPTAAMRKKLDDALTRSIARHRDRAARLAAEADYYAEPARKYEQAARYPWLPVEPNPPEP